MNTIFGDLFSIAYPFRFYLGTIKTVTKAELIEAQIKLFLETVKGERKLLPDYGLPELIHENSTDLDQTEAIILANLVEYFPDYDFSLSCELDSAKRKCNLTVVYPEGNLVVVFEI